MGRESDGHALLIGEGIALVTGMWEPHYFAMTWDGCEVKGCKNSEANGGDISGEFHA